MNAKPVVYFIDDSATMREVIKIAFLREDLEVITCHDASSAMDLMEHNAPDVVISDVIMPGRDGYDLCQYVKQHPRIGKTPVILISGVVNRGVAERAFAVHAAELIRKPFQPQDLIARVRHLLSPVEAAPEPPTDESVSAALSSIFSGAMPTRSASGQPRTGPVAVPPRAISGDKSANISGTKPRPVSPSIAATVAAAMQPAVMAPPVSIPGAQITGAVRIPLPPPVAGRVPAPPVPGNLSDAGKMRLEILRLQSQIKKLEMELAAEREYTRSLEHHVNSLQEPD
jgi:CheY-like chemotaxis protein